jgi:alkylated DNA repair protein (DNA oxidative demethylase)
MHVPDKLDETVTIAGFRHLQGFLNASRQQTLLADIRGVIGEAALYSPCMPRTGKPLSVAMTNAGTLGWVTDRDGGYRYQAHHPISGRPWPAIPASLLGLWEDLAGYPAPPEACLVNYYGAGAKLGSHVDGDEQETSAPVLSVSLGDDAIFHIGGLKRTDPRMRIRLRSGDVVILGGRARLAYHGVDRILPGTSTLLEEGGRFNLTLRRVTPSAIA